MDYSVQTYKQRRAELDADIAMEVGFLDDSPIDSAKRVIAAQNAAANEFNARRWPPNDTTLMTSADWVH